MLKFEGVFWENSGTKIWKYRKIGKGLTTVIWVNYHPPGNDGNDHNIPVFGGKKYEKKCLSQCCSVLKSGGQLLAPCELVLEDRVKRLAAQRKIVRLALYRFCRAIAIQLKQRTNGRVTLNNFTHTDHSQLAKLLKPLNPNLLRVVQRARDETTLGGDILISRSV